MPLGKLWLNRRGAARARGVIKSELGQSRRFGSPSMTSGFPPKADTVTAGRHVSKVPKPEINRTMPKSWQLVGGHSLMHFFALR
jgi:hypothetical protein